MENGRLSQQSLHRSVSRSTLSRNQSLIKRATQPHDLRPSDVLIERFVAWKAIVKQLIAYFQGIADIENNVARELMKLGSVIQVPFRAGNQFLGEGGLQDVYYGIRDKTRVIADHHANLGRTVDSSIVQHLEKLRTEVKAHIKNIQNDTGKLATAVAHHRETSARLITELSTNITLAKNSPMSISAKNDPYLTNLAVASQLRTQIHAENLLQKSTILMQQSSAHFEAGIVRALKAAWAVWEEWRGRREADVGHEWAGVLKGMWEAVGEEEEWLGFAGRCSVSGNAGAGAGAGGDAGDGMGLVDPETPLRDVEWIVYPGKEDVSVRGLHAGWMERKKRVVRRWREGWFVVTPAGWLHEFRDADEGPHAPASEGGRVPEWSLFLPECTLGPPSGGKRGWKFHIEEGREGMGTTKGGHSLGGLIKRASLTIAGDGSGSGHAGTGKAWSFRLRSREEMMEWWNDLRMLCARYLVASESMERARGGVVGDVVRGIGYRDEDEEEDEEEEGSSVEEEHEEVYGGDHLTHDQQEEEYAHKGVHPNAHSTTNVMPDSASPVVNMSVPNMNQEEDDMYADAESETEPPRYSSSHHALGYGTNEKGKGKERHVQVEEGEGEGEVAVGV